MTPDRWAFVPHVVLLLTFCNNMYLLLNSLYFVLFASVHQNQKNGLLLTGCYCWHVIMHYCWLQLKILCFPVLTNVCGAFWHPSVCLYHVCSINPKLSGTSRCFIEQETLHFVQYWLVPGTDSRVFL